MAGALVLVGVRGLRKFWCCNPGRYRVGWMVAARWTPRRRSKGELGDDRTDLPCEDGLGCCRGSPRPAACRSRTIPGTLNRQHVPPSLVYTPVRRSMLSLPSLLPRPSTGTPSLSIRVTSRFGINGSPS